MKVLIVLSVLLACASAIEWSNFKQQFQKVYKSPAEELMRKLNFEKKVRQIEEHNKRFHNGEESYEMGINQYSDMSYEEFAEKVTPQLNPEEHVVNEQTTYQPSGRAVPDSIDWRTRGAVTPVKNQGTCGSCYTFAAAAAMEGAYYLKTGSLYPLSEQNLLDCTTVSPYSNMGCNGGWASRSLQYIVNNGGIDYEYYYPYDGALGKCRYNYSYRGATARKVINVAAGENNLKAAVGEKGPVAVSIYSSDAFNNYKSGVFTDNNCNGRGTNHLVTVVGYGTDSYYGDYWLIKNSWGTWWGEQGYMRMARNRNNMCLVASYGVYPEV
ncbi:CG6357 [Drosophila busckii]|uniref:cathepsin L n=1 Tax=Drosophila busckii TaxID=30019 RepID=A0A0M4EIX4_DROBS|nr:crustapain-like [Drosophila busckii]ALC42822.1 CG6357 [Drosophila busckii]